MAQNDYQAYPVADLMTEIGQQLRAAIKQQSSITAFAETHNIPRRTLTRLLAGDDVGWETVVRVLRALERWDVLVSLLQTPAPSPMELLKQQQRHAKPARSATTKPAPFEAHLAKPFGNQESDG